MAEGTMRKVITMLPFLVLVAAPAASADTIYLKNGSVIKGKVASYSDDQFVVMLNTGSDRQSSRAQIFSGDVARIEFEASAGVEAASSPSDLGPGVSSPPIKTVTVEPKSEGAPTQPATNTPKEETPTVTSPESPPPVASDKDKNQPVAADPEPVVTKKPKGQVRSATVDVIAKRDWTSSGLIVRRGDTIRITASGIVTLDPNSGQTSGPEGIDQGDPKKLMADKPTGSLIAVIGADNDDFIFVGRSAEFSAARDGLLFLSVNEGTLSDNSGSFKAVIEVESGRK
jgi:hypothetical protein